LATAEPAPLLVRFVLAGEGRHALGAGLALGPALCDQEEPAPGWVLHGFTSAGLDRVGCHGCRLVARRLVEAAQQTRPELVPDPHRL
jgi:hypothetical protein